MTDDNLREVTHPKPSKVTESAYATPQQATEDYTKSGPARAESAMRDRKCDGKFR